MKLRPISMDVARSWQRASGLDAGRVLMWCGLHSLLLAALAWTTAQPGVMQVLAGGQNIAQVTENAKAGELNLETADLARIRKDVIALGEPVKA